MDIYLDNEELKLQQDDPQEFLSYLDCAEKELKILREQTKDILKERFYFGAFFTRKGHPNLYTLILDKEVGIRFYTINQCTLWKKSLPYHCTNTDHKNNKKYLWYSQMKE